jgi:hypothetical protein
MDWIQLAQKWDKWQDPMNTTINNKKSAVNVGFHKTRGTALLLAEQLASEVGLWSLALLRH